MDSRIKYRYNGSASFDHVPTAPQGRDHVAPRRSSTASGGAPPVTDGNTENPQPPSNPSLATSHVDKNHKLQEPSEGPDSPLLNEPEDMTPEGYAAAFRVIKKAYVERKSELLTLKDQLIEKDQKINRASAAGLQMQQTVIQHNKIVLQRDKAINKVELENEELKSENFHLKVENNNLKEELSRVQEHRRTRAPSHKPPLASAARIDPNYTHPDAPHENLKYYRRFEPTRKYEIGKGKVGPSRYGSNGRWDLGLCQIHFFTPMKFPLYL